MTLVAESDVAIIGVGEYHAVPRTEQAKVAFAVADAHHHEGIAGPSLSTSSTRCREQPIVT